VSISRSEGTNWRLIPTGIVRDVGRPAEKSAFSRNNEHHGERGRIPQLRITGFGGGSSTSAMLGEVSYKAGIA
jgi:hypothetical protein